MAPYMAFSAAACAIAPASFGGFLSHAAMAVILVGLIGSSMYVTEKGCLHRLGRDEAKPTPLLEIRRLAIIRLSTCPTP